jgi:dipeptidyl aminopeptidase/acylaminoacyl peptidase
MIMRYLPLILLGAALSARASAQQAVEPAAAVADRLVSISSMVTGDGPFWSGDGSRVLYLSSRGGPSLWSVPARGGTAALVARGVSGQLVRLAPRGDQLAFLSEQGGHPEIWVQRIAPLGARPAESPARRLTNLGARINALSWSPDGATIAFSALRYGQFDLWTVAVATGRVTRLTSDPRYETYPVWTPDGGSILYVRSDDRWADHEVMLLPAGGGAARVVASDRDLFDYGTIGTRARFGYPVVSPDGAWVLFRSHRSGWLNYWMAPLAGGEPRRLAPEEADQSDAVWAPDGSRVAFVANRNGTQDLRLVAAAGGEPRPVMALERGVVGSVAWSPDGRELAYTLGSPTSPQDLYVAAAAGGTARRLTASIDPAVAARLLTPEKVTYPSDGFTIAAYLYRSRAGGGRRPGVLLIHGGPTGQFSDTYLPQAQFLASQGYVVLAPNIRGSSGYGKPFEDANNPCWTHCDLRDVVAGVEFLKTLPEVDPSRMGITGNSYGGIMSMGAVAHAPDVFQASVPQSGYADWISFQDYNAELQHTKLLAYEWGPYPDSAAVYRRNSSIYSAHRVTAPVFALHGEGRTPSWRPGVLPIPASLEFVHALERLNKVVRYKVYPGESYYVGGSRNARQVMLDMLEFFDQYLRDGVVRPPSEVVTSRATPEQKR